MDHFYKSLIIEISIFVLLVAALGGGLVFMKTEISESATKIENNRKLLFDRSEALKSISVLKSQYESKGQNYLNVLHNIITTKDQLIDLKQEFQILATKNNLSFGFSFSPSEEAATPTELGSLEFVLSTKGSIDELISFVRDLQQFKYLITLDGFSLNRENSGIQMTIKGQAYFRGQ